MVSLRKIWIQLSEIGVRPGEPFTSKNKIRIVNRLTFIAFGAAMLYFLFELLFLPPRASFELQLLFYGTHVVLALIGLMILAANHHGKRGLASILFILLFGTIFLPNTLLLAKPMRMEMYMFALGASVFIFFDNPRTIFAVFLIPVAVYFVVAVNLQHRYPEIFLLDTGAIIRIGIAFLFTYQVMNLFKRENKNHQREIESKNQELTQQRNQLAQVNVTKDRIFSIISHDLRGPISSLRTLLEMQNNAHLTQEEFLLMSKALHAQVDLVHGTLDNLLQWSMAQVNAIKANPEKIELNELIVTVYELVNPAAKAKGIQFDRNIPGAVHVFADLNMVRSIFINLLSNAIKFTPAGGAVSLVASAQQNVIEILVVDTGIGMTQKEVGALFSGTHHSTRGTENEPGTGLGLQLVKEFVEKVEGTISVSSIPGKGTTFKLCLPASPSDGTGINRVSPN